jgi:hypothetical protein
MLRSRTLLILFLGICTAPVFGKPSSGAKTKPAEESGREMSSSDMGTNSWYTQQYSGGPEANSAQLGTPAAAVGTARDTYVEAATMLGYGTPGQVDNYGGGGEQVQFGGAMGPSSVFKYQVHPTHSHGGGVSYGEPSSSYGGGHENSLSYGAHEIG